MNNGKYSICVRCGKVRIESSSVQEIIGNSTIVTTDTICPDENCQKKVDEMLAGEQQKRKQSATDRAVREKARMKSRRKDITLN